MDLQELMHEWDDLTADERRRALTEEPKSVVFQLGRIADELETTGQPFDAEWIREAIKQLCKQQKLTK